MAWNEQATRITCRLHWLNKWLFISMVLQKKNHKKFFNIFFLNCPELSIYIVCTLEE